MKSEHRHYLAENDLEHRLGALAERLKPYANQILLGLVGVGVVVSVLVFWLQRSNASLGEGWVELAACTAPGDFLTVADRFAGTRVAHWALIRAGEEFLGRGIPQLFSHRAAADDELQKAQDAFERLLKDSSVAPDIRERALNGLARTLEARSDGDNQPAIEAYRRLITEFPESRFRRWAEDRMAVLERPEVGEFYAWFRTQNPNPADRGLPNDPHSQLFPGLDFSNFPGLMGDEFSFEDDGMLGDDLFPADPDASSDTTPPENDGEMTTPEGETDTEAAPATDRPSGPSLGPPAEASATTEPPETQEPPAAPEANAEPESGGSSDTADESAVNP